VVTLVLYFGTKERWNAPRNLKGLMNIPSGLDEFVNDYHINVVEVAWLTEEEISRFHSDFRIVANFFRNKRLNENYTPDDPTVIKHVDEMLKLLSVMTGDNQYEIQINMADNGGVSMCTVAQNLVNKGKIEGKIEGRTEERLDTIKNMISNGFSADQISKFCGYDLDFVNKVAESLT
jgi:hypothetical protein